MAAIYNVAMPWCSDCLCHRGVVTEGQETKQMRPKTVPAAEELVLFSALEHFFPLASRGVTEGD